MSMSNVKTATPTIINACDNHKTGNGIACEWRADSENYSTNTMEGNVTISNE